MSPTLQLLVVAATVLAALAFSLRRLRRAFRGRSAGCCSDDSGGALRRDAIKGLPDCSRCSGKCSACD